jgi:hypothetical protein
MVGYMSPFLSLQDLEDDIAGSNNKVLCACLQDLRCNVLQDLRVIGDIGRHKMFLR